jgi:hypothetical protein
LIEIADDALRLEALYSTEVLEYEGVGERYVPDLEFRRKVSRRNSRDTFYAAAITYGRPSALRAALTSSRP